MCYLCIIMSFTDSEIRYPVGIQSFSEIIEGGYVYVDKTAVIYNLINSGKYFFLSRPRRFGKSLLLSTIEAYFQGRKDLFDGLAIQSLTDKWESHPILHLDLNNRNYKDENSLTEELNSNLEKWEALYGDEKRDREVEERFEHVIYKAYQTTGKKVVILIDEYDKPLLNTIDQPDVAKKYREILKAFYGNLKTMDRYIQFAMLTGVARFSKISIFSDLNNLRDISFSTEFSSICGITPDELKRDFRYGISKMAEAYGVSCEDMTERLRLNYDGYHFTVDGDDVYNPFSLIYAFAENYISSFWFETGTPTFLVKLLLNGNFKLQDLEGCRIKRSNLIRADIHSDDPVPAFYQTGYLTILDYNPQFDQFILGYPNREVKEGFLEFLLPYYIKSPASKTEFDISRFVDDVCGGNVESFMKRLEALIAKVPYSEKGAPPEAHFQNAVYLIYTLMGFYTRMEERISDGRIDVTVETEKYIYLFEFKIDSDAASSIGQIHKKEYWTPYTSTGKRIIAIGVNFDTRTRRLDSYLTEEIYV